MEHVMFLSKLIRFWGILKMEATFTDDLDTPMITIRAKSSKEADLLKALYNNGVQIVSGGSFTLTITDPKVSNTTILALNRNQLKIVHEALAEHPGVDNVIADLLHMVYPEIEEKKW